MTFDQTSISYDKTYDDEDDESKGGWIFFLIRIRTFFEGWDFLSVFIYSETVQWEALFVSLVFKFGNVGVLRKKLGTFWLARSF